MSSVIEQLFKNITVTYLGIVIGLVITFFFTPYLISMLEKERYGIWQLAFSILSYLDLADLGMKQSIVRYYSKYYAVRDWKQLNQVFSSAVRVYLAIAGAIVVIVFAIIYGVLDRFQIPSEFYRVAQIVTVILGIDRAMAYIFVPFTAVGGFHRFDVSNYYRMARQIFQTLSMIILLELGYGLVAMAIAVVCLNFLQLSALNFYRMRKFPEVSFSVKAIDPVKTKLLFSYGIYSFLIVTTVIVIFQTDNLVIGWFLSMEAVALYSIAGALISQIRGIITVIAVPLVPTISHLEAEGNFLKIQEIYIRGVRYLYYFSTYVGVCILVFGKSFIFLWLGEDFAPSVDVMNILIVGGAVFYPQVIANSILFGLSKHKIAFYVLAAEAIANIFLSILLVKSYGMVGVAYGTAIPQILIYAFVYPYVFHKVIRSSLKVFYVGVARSIGLGLVTTLPMAALVRTVIPSSSWMTLVVDCIAVTLVMFLTLSKFVLEPDDRERLVTRFRKIISKFGIR